MICFLGAITGCEEVGEEGSGTKTSIGEQLSVDLLKLTKA